MEFFKVLFKIEEIDFQAEKFSIDFLENVPDYIKTLLLEGNFDDESVSAYYEFLQGDIDITIDELTKNTESANLLAIDLSDSLKNFSACPKKTPSFDLLIKLWREKCHDFLTPYYRLTLFCLIRGFNSFKIVIDTADLSLSMSEAMITFCLNKVGIKNENGYNINAFNKENIKLDSLKKTVYEEINSKDDVKKVLDCWLEKVSNELGDNNSDWYQQTHLMSVFYRFIQFARARDHDYRNDLAKYLVMFIQNENILNTDKKTIIELITEECKKYLNPIDGKCPVTTPLETLFDNNIELVNSIKKFSKKNSIKYINSFHHLLDLMRVR